MKTIEVSSITINNNNKLIAKFLGWFNEPDQPDGIWFKIVDGVKYVSYRQYDDMLNELPFHKDWNYLMNVVEKIENMRYGIEITPGAGFVYDMNKAQFESRYESAVLPVCYNVHNNKIIHIWFIVSNFVKWYLNEKEK
jgi:hypothetical protein